MKTRTWTVIGVISAGIIGIIAIIINIVFYSPSAENNHSGNGDIVAGDKNMYSYANPSTHKRTLNPLIEQCLLDKINKHAPKNIEVAPQTYPLEQRSKTSSFLTLSTSEETENFSKELTRLFESRGYSVTRLMSLEPGSGVATGVTILPIDNKTVRILVGENNGSEICVY